MANVLTVKEKAMSNDDGKLTPEQIENWRKVLVMQLGPYALMMPDEEVQMMRDKMQEHVDNME